MTFRIDGFAHLANQTLKMIESGCLPNGLFGRLLGKAIQWAARTTSSFQLGNYGLFSDAAVLAFGHQRFKLTKVQALRAVRVDVEGASPLAILTRIQSLVAEICASYGSLEHLTALTAACQEDPEGLMYEPVTNADGTITPSLMTFGEVETLFHECGHALQHMLTRVDEGHVSGIRGVEWDAVEQPV